MTADEAVAVTEMYQAAGVVTRELGVAIDMLAALDRTPLEDVHDTVAAALMRMRRSFDAAAWVRERYG